MILYFICGHKDIKFFFVNHQISIGGLALVIGDWPVPDYTQYIAQRITERGGLTLSAPFVMPYRSDVSSLPTLSWTPCFLYRLDSLHVLPRDAQSFGRSPTLRGRDGHCV